MQVILRCPSSSVHCQAISRSAFAVPFRTSFQFLVGASRRRAAPRNQSSGAAHVSPCHFIDWRRPLKLQNCSELHQSRVPEKKFQLCFIPVSFGVKQIKRCGLTRRSTGPIAAGRHLGYKSLAQIPTRRNRPVSLYVRPHWNGKLSPMAENSQKSGKVLMSAYCQRLH